MPKVHIQDKDADALNDWVTAIEEVMGRGAASAVAQTCRVSPSTYRRRRLGPQPFDPMTMRAVILMQQLMDTDPDRPAGPDDIEIGEFIFTRTEDGWPRWRPKSQS